MINSRKYSNKKVLILVEGTSDVAFLSLLIINKYGYEYIKKVEFNIDKSKGEYCSNYKLNKDEVIICSVGGHGNFNNFYNEYIYKYLRNTKEKPTHLIVILDADQNKNTAIKNIDFKDLIFKENMWELQGIYDDNNQDYKMYDINIYLKVIPENQCGALETLIIDSFKETHLDIVNESCSFVDGLNCKNSDHLKEFRINIKTKVGTIINIIDCQKTFSTLSDRFDKVDLNTDIVNRTFTFLEFLKSQNKN